MNRAAKVAIPYAGWVPVPCFGSRGPDHASRLVTRPSGPSIMGRAASCRRAGRPKRSARARIRSQAWLFTSSGPIQRRAPFLRRTQERSTTHAPSTSGSEQSRPAPRLRRRSFRFAPLGARPTPRARGRTSTTAILNQPKQRFSLDRRRPSIEVRMSHQPAAQSPYLGPISALPSPLPNTPPGCPDRTCLGLRPPQVLTRPRLTGFDDLFKVASTRFGREVPS